MPFARNGFTSGFWWYPHLFSFLCCVVLVVFVSVSCVPSVSGLYIVPSVSGLYILGYPLGSPYVAHTLIMVYRNRNRNKFINQIRAPGGHLQITIMIDTQQQYIKLYMSARHVSPDHYLIFTVYVN